jgi:hypothetical protein
MKLLNSDEPFPENPRKPEPDPKAEEPFGLPVQGIVHGGRPLPPSTINPEALDAPEPDAPAAPAPNRPTHAPVRSSGQGVPPRLRRFTKPANGAKSADTTKPDTRLRDAEEAGKHAKPLKLPLRYRLRPDKQKTRFAFWDIAAALSLIVNAILLGVVVVMGLQIRNLKIKEAVTSGLLGGLYNSFVEMDQASIQTTITVDAQIPLNFSLPLQQNTTVVLTENTSIPGAHVTINTPLINISAPANVTLPAGTNLPIALNMNIPVQTTIPVTLQVPVNIPLSGTGLHTPFVNLQKSIQPYYCMLDPNAKTPQGSFICSQNP